MTPGTRQAAPGSPEYRRDYNLGWRACERAADWDGHSPGPMETAGALGAGDAWYDGWEDRAAGREKWTWQTARLAGFDSLEDYSAWRHEAGAA